MSEFEACCDFPLEKQSAKMALPGNDCSYIHSVAESLFILGSLKSLPDMDLLVSPGNQVAWPRISACHLQLEACLNSLNMSPGESPPLKVAVQPNEDPLKRFNIVKTM